MDHAIGIDIGTSAVKVVLVGPDEAPVAAGEAALQTLRPRAGWSEQDPESWWDATCAVLDGLARDHAAAMARVGAVGLSGQSHAPVLLGADHRPLRSAILWNDGRAEAEAAEIAAAHPGLPHRVGVLCMPSFTAPKILWLSRHEPQTMDRLRLLLLPKDYVRLKLCGELATDMADASGTWWLEQATRAWCEPALTASAMPAGALPRLVEGSDPTGVVRPVLARRWGWGEGVVVAGGTGDAAAGAVGLGAVEGGDAFLQIGTSAQLFVTADRYRPVPDPETAVHAFSHGLPGRWYQMGAMLNGASCLAYVAQLLGAPVEALLADIGERPGAPSPVLFLPYLAGERTPHNDARARGVIFGLSPGTPRPDVVQAVLEGVAFSFADCRDALAASGVAIAAAGVTGGGARSRAWMRILASVLGIPLTRYQGGDKGPAFGAARLGRLARDGADLSSCTRPTVLDVTEPVPDLAEAYGARLEHFRHLYRSLRPVFAEAVAL